MVNGLFSFSVNFVNQRIGAQTLRVALFTGLVVGLMVGGGQMVVAGPPRGVPQVSGGSPIEIQIDRYGFEWCVVGDVNNPPFPGNVFNGSRKGAGVVPYKYRITRTELTTEQYLEFVNAYWPFYDGDPVNAEFYGLFIFARWEGDHPVYGIMKNYEQVPTTISLRMAARYCNWLQNGKINEQWAFDTGVYDASTFTRNEDGSFNDDYTRSPDARYWVPNVDEWMKAAYYDPNKWDTGRGGWWDYPNKTDQPLLIGFPAESGEIPIPTQIAKAGITGETNGSLDNWPAKGMSAGSYPWVQSPWGLRDVSGGLSEIAFPWEMGSSFFFSKYQIMFSDSAGHIGLTVAEFPTISSQWGLRIASRVPSQIKR